MHYKSIPKTGIRYPAIIDLNYLLDIQPKEHGGAP